MARSIISRDADVANTLNTFFRDAVDSLDIQVNKDLLNPIKELSQDPIDTIIEEFASHPSILKIK